MISIEEAVWQQKQPFCLVFVVDTTERGHCCNQPMSAA
jgi:hypothetical protein